MHQKIAQLFRLPALLLAAALQIMPIARAALPAAQATADVLAIVFRWAAGAAAVLGGVQAVSGASTVITSPLSTNIVQGKAFAMRLTTAPQQAGYWSASGLPAGISLVGTSGSSFWQLSGTPTVTGTYSVGLTAKSSANAGSSRDHHRHSGLQYFGGRHYAARHHHPAGQPDIDPGTNCHLHRRGDGHRPFDLFLAQRRHGDDQWAQSGADHRQCADHRRRNLLRDRQQQCGHNHQFQCDAHGEYCLQRTVHHRPARQPERDSRPDRHV